MGISIVSADAGRARCLKKLLVQREEDTQKARELHLKERGMFLLLPLFCQISLNEVACRLPMQELSMAASMSAAYSLHSWKMATHQSKSWLMLILKRQRWLL